jgi:hypothetical protein
VPLVDEKLTLPIGEEPVTVAVQVVGELVPTGFGEHVNDVEELVIAFVTVSALVPELP